MLDDIWKAIAALTEDLEFHHIVIIGLIVVLGLIGLGGSILDWLMAAKSAVEPLDEWFTQ